MFALGRKLSGMDSAPLPRMPGIRDEEISDSAPTVRALIVHRLEQIWSTIEPHVNGSRAEEGWSPDVRFVEAGIRCLDRLAKVYRLDQPVAANPLAGDVASDTRALVAAQLAEIEERMRDAGQG